jgi:hypothetical protein
MSVAYTLYLTEPSRNLETDPDEAEWRQLEDLHKIDNIVRALAEDIIDLLPAGWTLETVKEIQ